MKKSGKNQLPLRILGGLFLYDVATLRVGRSQKVSRNAQLTSGIVRVDLSPMSFRRSGLQSFSRQLRTLREQFGGKQLWLAHAVGCTEAAVSFWETGKRIPYRCTLSRIVDALMEAGASATEVAVLCRCWREVAANRSDINSFANANIESNTPLRSAPSAASPY